MIYSILGLVIGLAVGFFVSKWYLEKEQAKNPVISEKMIRAYMIQMGLKPNEQKIKRIMQKVNACK